MNEKVTNSLRVNFNSDVAHGAWVNKGFNRIYLRARAIVLVMYEVSLAARGQSLFVVILDFAGYLLLYCFISPPTAPYPVISTNIRLH